MSERHEQEEAQAAEQQLSLIAGSNPTVRKRGGDHQWCRLVGQQDGPHDASSGPRSAAGPSPARSGQHDKAAQKRPLGRPLRYGFTETGAINAYVYESASNQAVRSATSGESPAPTA